MKEQIITGDCIELMKKIPDGSIDLILTDPPYNAKNIGPNARTYSLGQMKLPEKEYKKFCSDWFREAKRIAKRIVFTPGIANMTNYPQPDWVLCWSKPQAVSFNRFGGFNVWEPIFVYGKRAKGKRVRRDLIEIGIRNLDKGPRSKHPYPKPLDLIKKLIDIFSNEEDLILDPFVGSGTVTEGARLLNREYIGIDINPEYCEIAKSYLRQQILGLIPPRVKALGILRHL